MRSSKKIVVSIIAVTSLGLTSVQAEETRFYIGANYGNSEIDTGVSGLTGTATLDEKDHGLKIYAGYDINKIVSVEGHYVNLGEATLKGNNGDQFTYEGTAYQLTANSVNVSLEGKSIGLSALVKLPVSEMINPFFKAGIHNWDAKSSISSSAVNASLDDDGTDMFYGIGMNVAVNKSLSVRGEFERFDFDGDDVDYLSFGMVYKF